jgi:hypothetical protein
MLTTLAIVFVLLLIGAIFYGVGIVMRRPPTVEELRTEKCSLCGNKFPKEELVERQIGDYKLYFFCASCIMGLHEEVQERDITSGLDAKKLLSEVHEKRN